MQSICTHLVDFPSLSCRSSSLHISLLHKPDPPRHIALRTHRAQTHPHNPRRPAIHELNGVAAAMPVLEGGPHLRRRPGEVVRHAAGIAQRAAAHVDTVLVRSMRDVLVADEGAVGAADVERNGGALGQRIAIAGAGVVVDVADGGAVGVAEVDELVVEEAHQVRGVRRDLLHGAEELGVHVEGVAECEDGVEGQSAVFDALVDGRGFLGVPGRAQRDDHVDGAAAEVAALVEHVSGGFPHDEGAEIWEAEDFVEAQDGEVWGRRGIAEVESACCTECGGVEEGVDFLPVAVGSFGFSNLTRPDTVSITKRRSGVTDLPCQWQSSACHIRLSWECKETEKTLMAAASIIDPALDIVV